MNEYSVQNNKVTAPALYRRFGEGTIEEICPQYEKDSERASAHAWNWIAVS